MIWITNTFLSKYQIYEGTQQAAMALCVSCCFLYLNFTKAHSLTLPATQFKHFHFIWEGHSHQLPYKLLVHYKMWHMTIYHRVDPIK